MHVKHAYVFKQKALVCLTRTFVCAHVHTMTKACKKNWIKVILYIHPALLTI